MALRSISYQNLSDEALMPEIAEGSSAAFDELYKRYGQKLFSYFFRMLWKNKELTEDCTQELFIKLMKAAKSFEREEIYLHGCTALRIICVKMNIVSKK